MEKQMMPFVDGRLKVSEQREVEAHLAVCAACRVRVNEFSRGFGIAGRAAADRAFGRV